MDRVGTPDADAIAWDESAREQTLRELRHLCIELAIGKPDILMANNERLVVRPTSGSQRERVTHRPMDEWLLARTANVTALVGHIAS